MARLVKASHFSIYTLIAPLGLSLSSLPPRPPLRSGHADFIPFPFGLSQAAASNDAFFFSFFSFEMNFPMKKQSANDHFGTSNGTTQYHRYPATGFVYTDGLRDLATTCQSFWLLDLIISYQHQEAVAAEGFQVWYLEQVLGNCYKVSCDDGNGNIIATQVIPFSDFPYQSAHLWLIGKCLLLPNEY